jgi:hypothetical protein
VLRKVISFKGYSKYLNDQRDRSKIIVTSTPVARQRLQNKQIDKPCYQLMAQQITGVDIQRLSSDHEGTKKGPERNKGTVFSVRSVPIYFKHEM